MSFGLLDRSGILLTPPFRGYVRRDRKILWTMFSGAIKSIRRASVMAHTLPHKRMKSHAALSDTGNDTRASRIEADGKVS
jgi:hypothetical protein